MCLLIQYKYTEFLYYEEEFWHVPAIQRWAIPHSFLKIAYSLERDKYIQVRLSNYKTENDWLKLVHWNFSL